MFRKMLLKEKRVAQLYTLILFLILSTVFFLVTLYAQINADQIQRNKIEVNEQSVINVESAMIESEIKGIISDLLYVTDTLQIEGFASDDYTNLTQQWVAFSNRKIFYDQIRYIDRTGDEIIRVDHDETGVQAAEQQALQNKKNRYYFTETMALNQNQVYISKLDLNVENGEIELPIKPMLRLSTPVLNADGNPEGLVILNYAANNTLLKVNGIASTSWGYIYILNADGYWVYNGEDSSKEWAFMYDDRLNESFASEYPEEWEAIRTGGQGSINSDSGVFRFAGFGLDQAIISSDTGVSLVCASTEYYIVSYIPADTELGLLFSSNGWILVSKVLVKYLSIYFLLSGVAFVLASFIAVNKGQKKEIKYYSEHDTMTGVYNRRTGYEKLSRIRQNRTQEEYSISICFIDINGLKEINDELGHDMGDELIVTVSMVIKENIRGNDFVARLGGDEFLIVFEGMDAQDAENIWLRIVQKFEQINTEENRRYLISVSHGIEALRYDSNKTLDAVINQADEIMYMEKRRIKKNLKVVRDQ